MFNVTVLKMSDIIKYLVGVILAIFVITYATRCIPIIKNKAKNEEDKKQTKIEVFKFGALTSCLDKTISTMGDINKEYSEIEKENEKIFSESYLEQFLKTEISSIKGIENIEKINLDKSNEKVEKEKEIQQDSQNSEVNLANTKNIKTEVVTQNPISETFNVQYGNVKIKNQTKYELTEELLKPDINIDNKNILIFHTHSCESYTSSEKYPYTQTGNFRTTDLNYTVTGVGNELESYLKKYNLNVIHDTSYHDYPAYNGSYTRSLQTVESILKTQPSDIIIDLHRDAIGSRPDYAPTVKIGDDYVAQIMFVIRNK